MSFKESIALAIYRVVLWLSGPFLLIRLFLRGRHNPAYRQRIRERFGFYPHLIIKPRGFWVHAVSVGEANAALPIIRQLRLSYPGRSMMVTCTTPTGSSVIQQAFDIDIKNQQSKLVQHVYLPFDRTAGIRRFFKMVKPQTGLIMETELWPNLSHVAHQHGVNLMVVNLRLSEKSFRAYQRVNAITAPILRCFNRFAVQYDADAQRLQKLGATKQQIHLTGNIKFDISPDKAMIEAAQRKREEMGRRMVWLAGSTHEGEEQSILDTHRALQKSHPDLLLILIPRHPERFNEVAVLCQASFSLQRFTESSLPRPDTSVFLVDVMGALTSMISLSDVAFIGGSLVPVGGHNLLEACAASVPVVFGPYRHNFQTIADMVIEAEAGVQIEDEAALFKAVSILLSEPMKRQTMGQNGLMLLRQNQGSIGKVISLIKNLDKGHS